MTDDNIVDINSALDAEIGARETGAGLLSRVESFLGRFVAYPSEHARVAHTLWIAHAHLMDCWFTTPRLAFMSAEKESGKTRALEVTELLVPEPLLSINISAAALVRKVAAGPVTILYDEIDALFGNAAREEGNVDVRSILNGGYRRGAKVHRCVPKGKSFELEELPAFTPAALAGLKGLPDTLASRSIMIRMRRRAPDEHVEQFRLRKLQSEAEALFRSLYGWAEAIAEKVEDAEPDMPDGIVDRAAECWEPLFAVADAAGGDWPKRVRDAAKHLIAGSTDDSLTEGVELLSHIREAFQGEEKLWTEILLQRLHNRPESPWNDIRGKPINDRGLAARLKQYGIKSKDIRIGDKAKKGYDTASFADAWKRYLACKRDKRDKRDKIDNENKNVAAVADVADIREESAAFDERAAVLEYDAGLPREEAEQRAADDLAIPPFLDRR